MDKKRLFMKGLRDGLPIGAGYFAVSFSLGIMAHLAGLRAAEGFLMSFLTHASAGEYAGLQVMLEDSGYFAMAVMTLVASARYFLMGCALSQRLSPGLGTAHRLLIVFGLTDEIFAMEIRGKGHLEPVYAYGLFILPFFLWAGGTALGISMGNLLPQDIVRALSVALYGMFIAVIVPPARKEKPVALGVTAAFVLSFLCSRLPGIRGLSSGTRTILLTVLIASVLALLFPRKEDEA